MTIRDDIVTLLRTEPEGLTDAELGVRLCKLRQQVNQRCRALASEGLITRDATSGTIRNAWRSGGFVQPASVAEVATQSANNAAQATNPYFEDPWWEGRVQSALVDHLLADGWTIMSAADTASQEHGIDVVAEREGRRLLVEVKGYPGKIYARGPKTGQPKPTAPTLQAKHWFSDALLKALRTREKDPAAVVALAFPDMPRCRSLLAEVHGSLTTLDVAVFLVQADRSVTVWKDA